MYGCRLCLDPYAPGPIQPLEDPDVLEQIDTVFNFEIDTISHPEPSGVCQQCSAIVSEFYHFSIKVRENQEQLDQALERYIKLETTEFEEGLAGDEHEDGDEDVKEKFKEEPLEEDDEIYESPVEDAESNDEGGPSTKRKRMQTDQTDKPEKVNVDEKIKEEPSEEELSEEEQSEEDNDDSSDDDESYEPPPERVVQSSDEDDQESLTTRSNRIQCGSKKEQIEADFKKINEFYNMKCYDCGVVTEDFSSLDSHHKDVHNIEGFIVCCGRKMSKRKNMLEHILLHENPQAFRCNICNKQYAGSSSLASHKMYAHSREEHKVFKCKLCPQAFAMKHMLKDHMWKHKQVGCKECGKTFSTKHSLKSHYLKMHSGIDRRMICDICGKEFLDKIAFDRHIKEHAGIEVVKKLQCHICQRWLTGERRLKVHLQNTHYDQQTYPCNICNRQCPSKLALQAHQNAVHVAEKYQCEFCDAKFKQRQSLKEHRTIHTGEVLYSCEYCGKSTNSHANYYSHIKKNHPQEWALKQKSKAPKVATGSGSGT